MRSQHESLGYAVALTSLSQELLGRFPRAWRSKFCDFTFDERTDLTSRSSAWDSIVLPTASSLMPEEYTTMFPEFFLHLYYNSLPFQKSLRLVWAKSKRARFHTDLLVINRSRGSREISIEKILYAPKASRPWGIHLPTTGSLCGCKSDVRWKLRWTKPKQEYGELFFLYRSSCAHTEIAVAVFVDGLKSIQVDGTLIVVQHYDTHLGGFPLDRHDRFRIKAAVRVSFPTNRGFY